MASSVGGRVVVGFLSSCLPPQPSFANDMSSYDIYTIHSSSHAAITGHTCKARSRDLIDHVT